MVTRPSPNSTRMPVSTGRDSSLEAALATWLIVATNDCRSTAKAGPDGSGRWGKSSAPWACSEYSLGPHRIRTAPVPGVCSIVTSDCGSARTISSSSRPGSTVEPASCTCAGTGTRTESSMSVAASSTGPPASARSRTPERI